MSAFKKVIYVPGQAEIAKVNRDTGTLYLSAEIWKGLPAQEKNFVLLHEAGHLTMKTADEFRANEYAVSNFAKAGTLNNAQLGQKILVMRSILDKADGQTSNLSDTLQPEAAVSGGLFSGIGAILTGAGGILQVTGIGSKARQAEAAANAQAQATIYGAQATATAAKNKSMTKILIITGVLVLVGAVLYFTLKK